MALNSIKIASFLCVLLPIWTSTMVEAASSHAAPAPAVDCSNLVLNMADCLSFVTSDSTAKKPEGSCCNGLKTVLKTNAECLCEAFKNSAQFGITLNVTKAMSLPSACHVSAPSISNCGLTSVGAAPALSPLALSPELAAGAPALSPGSIDITPVAAPTGSSGSDSTVVTISSGLFLLSFVAAALF